MWGSSGLWAAVSPASFLYLFSRPGSRGQGQSMRVKETLAGTGQSGHREPFPGCEL